MGAYSWWVVVPVPAFPEPTVSARALPAYHEHGPAVRAWVVSVSDAHCGAPVHTPARLPPVAYRYR